MSLKSHTCARAQTQAARILSTYSADTFGVCSALFELGGMIVIHDPSGCNSTYTTHDEPRWYDTDSLIFISAITEYDAILGRDDKLIEEITAAARELKPKFICIIPSQIAFLIATDLTAIAKLIEKRTGLPCFTLPTNSMHYYARGIYLALEQIAHWAAAAQKGQKKRGAVQSPRINLLGVTPLDFPLCGTRTSLAAFLAQSGLRLAACWAVGESLETLLGSADADANLVLTYGGLGAAHVLARECGTPYVVGTPFPPLWRALSTRLRQAVSRGDSSTTAPPFSCTQPPSDSKENFIIGEGIFSASLAAALKESTGKNFRIIVPVEHEDSLLPPDAIPLTADTALASRLASAALVLADPLYAAIVPAGVRFLPLPHAAFSGRLYSKDERNLLDPEEYHALVQEIQSKD